MSPPPPEKGKAPAAGDESSPSDSLPDQSDADIYESENAVADYASIDPEFVRDEPNPLEAPKADAIQGFGHQKGDQFILPRRAVRDGWSSVKDGSLKGRQPDVRSQEPIKQATQAHDLSVADSLSGNSDDKRRGNDGGASIQSSDGRSRIKTEASTSTTDDRSEDAANALALGSDEEVAAAQYAETLAPAITVKTRYSSDDDTYSGPVDRSRSQLNPEQTSTSANIQGKTTEDKASNAESNSASTDDEESNGREDPSKVVQRMMVDRVMASFMDWLDVKLKVKEEEERLPRLQDIKLKPASVASPSGPPDMPLSTARLSMSRSIKQLPVPPPSQRIAAPPPSDAEITRDRSLRSALFARMGRTKKGRAPMASAPTQMALADASGSRRTSTGEEATEKEALKTGSMLEASSSHGTEKLEREQKRSRLRGLRMKREVREREGVDLGGSVSPLVGSSSDLAPRLSMPSLAQPIYTSYKSEQSRSEVPLYQSQSSQAASAPAAPAAPVPAQAAPPRGRKPGPRISFFANSKKKKRAQAPAADVHVPAESKEECEEEDDDESVDLSLDFAVFEDPEGSVVQAPPLDPFWADPFPTSNDHLPVVSESLEASGHYFEPSRENLALSSASDYIQPPMMRSAVPLIAAAPTISPQEGLRPDTGRQSQAKRRKAGLSAVKRGRSNDRSKEQEDDDKDDGDGNRLPRAKLPRVQEDQISGAKLACPFFKHNPRKYKNMRPCCGPGWDHVHRIKEHIYRKHSLPKFSCPRCSQPFETQSNLQAHARSPDPCEVREPEVLDGITQDQEKKLRSRKKTTAKELTEAEKWMQVYSILFPDVREREIPSPYYRTEDAQTTLGGYEDYLRRELPPLVRRQLEKEVERELSFVEEGMKQKVIEIARNLQLTLFKGYQQLENQERGVDGPSPSTGDVSGSESGGYLSFATTNTSPLTMTTQGTTPELPDPLEIFSDPAIPDFDFEFLSQVPYPPAERQRKPLEPEFEFDMSGIPEPPSIQRGVELFPGQQVELPYYGMEGYDDGQARARDANTLSYVP